MKKILSVILTYLLIGCIYVIFILRDMNNMPAFITMAGTSGMVMLVGYGMLLWLPIIIWQLMYDFSGNTWQLLFVVPFVVALIFIPRKSQGHHSD